MSNIKKLNDYDIKDGVAREGIATLNEEVSALDSGKADKGTTLSAYGITDAYTKTEADEAIDEKIDEAIDEISAYSETETLIGTWNGSPLYRKIVYLGNMPNATTKSVDTGLNPAEVWAVKVYGYAHMIDGTTIVLPFFNMVPTAGIMMAFDNTGKIVLETQVDRSGYTGYAIIEYTKPV